MEQMTVKILSVKVKEVIAPRGTLQWSSDSTEIIFIEALNNIEVQIKEYREKLQFGDVIIAKKILLHNLSRKFVSFRGVIFHSDSLFTCSQQQHVLKLQNKQQESPFASYTRKVFFGNENITIDELEKQFSLMLQEMNIIEENSNYITKKLYGQIDIRLIVVNRFIREHYYKPLSLQGLADLVECNPVYLSNTYSRVFDVSPIKHMRNIRMKKAEELVKNSSIRINCIASQLGYTSVSQFINLFKQYYSKSPMQYREQNISRCDSLLTTLD